MPDWTVQAKRLRQLAEPLPIPLSVFVHGIPSSILGPTSRILNLPANFLSLAFSLRLCITGYLTSRFLHGALGLVCRALHSVLIHADPPNHLYGEVNAGKEHLFHGQPMRAAFSAVAEQDQNRCKKEGLVANVGGLRLGLAERECGRGGSDAGAGRCVPAPLPAPVAS